MRMRNLFARLQKPAVVTASFAMIVSSFAPSVEALREQPRASAHRVVATPVPPPVITPTVLLIPKIDLQAPIVPVGTHVDGTMAAPTTARDIGWWAGRKPGQGNALFAAHRDYNGVLGSFARLKELDLGDEVVVRGQGGVMTYRIVWMKRFDHNVDATELLGNQGEKQVATLITCDGVFDRSIGTSRERLVARAELVTV